MPYDVEWKQGAIEDVTMLFDYIAENSSLWDAQNVTDRVLTAADKLADFPRLYEVDSRYGEDVRRISLMGQHVLYDVDDQTESPGSGRGWPAPESPYRSLITGDGAQFIAWPSPVGQAQRVSVFPLPPPTRCSGRCLCCLRFVFQQSHGLHFLPQSGHLLPECFYLRDQRVGGRFSVSSGSLNPSRS